MDTARWYYCTEWTNPDLLICGDIWVEILPNNNKMDFACDFSYESYNYLFFSTPVSKLPNMPVLPTLESLDIKAWYWYAAWVLGSLTEDTQVPCRQRANYKFITYSPVSFPIIKSNNFIDTTQFQGYAIVCLEHTRYTVKERQRGYEYLCLFLAKESCEFEFLNLSD